MKAEALFYAAFISSKGNIVIYIDEGGLWELKYNDTLWNALERELSE